MKLVFVDETSDDKFKDYFGLSIATINSAHYCHIKTAFHQILTDSKWDPNKEFKGAYLFSAKKGDQSISIEKRIDICAKIIDLNIAKKNARMSFYYSGKSSVTDQKKVYLEVLPKLLKKALSKADSGNGKNLVSIYCDFRSDISSNDISQVVNSVLNAREYTLFEDVALVPSNFHTIGILYADIIGYLAARIDTISNDSDLFESIPVDQLENNGKLRKLKSSKLLIEKIKKLTIVNLDKLEKRQI
ncbi:MAG TPA: hypothetical protein DEE98_09005 [Elusimicrobia bacterium]|nr:MAG: hypothetical protein A2204_00190 [Elusimicrobia bacterium RIFOXYA1_FULL_47_7]OGS15735.1 MAG: hypothetical protein A2251_08610 [Elusimicrobia bacterium RIFOXYA2_FULL_47_53]OGS31036.1 MAG: hypothetical protein A2323_06930 [Elusimicrobia bacterium RIFOXYB2_FULL_46_23]HBU70501.1 hypothetical protein [Elusimicrobiota bacterium]